MNKLKIQEDIIYNKYIKNDLKIIHLADIHFNVNMKEKRLKLVSDGINKEKADYIIITGDIVDSAVITYNLEKMKELVNFFHNIAKNNKVIISLGNHDIKLDCKKFFNELSQIKNITVLDNENYFDKYLCISGLTLPSNFYYNKLDREPKKVFMKHLDKYSQLISDLPSDKLKIALIHSPMILVDNDILSKLANYDLILSGHMHDGMVPEFLKFVFGKNRGIISPYKRLFPKIARGKIVKKINDKEITLIITGGVTKLSLVSAKWLSKLNFVYNVGMNRIIIKRKEV